MDEIDSMDEIDAMVEIDAMTLQTPSRHPLDTLQERGFDLSLHRDENAID